MKIRPFILEEETTRSFRVHLKFKKFYICIFVTWTTFNWFPTIEWFAIEDQDETFKENWSNYTSDSEEVMMSQTIFCTNNFYCTDCSNSNFLPYYNFKLKSSSNKATDA